MKRKLYGVRCHNGSLCEQTQRRMRCHLSSSLAVLLPMQALDVMLTAMQGSCDCCDFLFQCLSCAVEPYCTQLSYFSLLQKAALELTGKKHLADTDSIKTH